MCMIEPFQKLRARFGYPLNWFKPPVILYITERSKAILLIWLSVFACFGVSFCTVFTFNLSFEESCSFGLPYVLFVF